MTVAASLLLVAAGAVASLRWLRVAQREHYLAGSVSRFWWRWLWSGWDNAVLWLAIVVLCEVGVFAGPLFLVAAACLVLVWPLRLPLRGRTAPLAWTRRLRTVAAVTAVFGALVVIVGWILFDLPQAAALFAVGVPFLVDGALVATAPVEARLADRHLKAAAAKLARIKPVVVAITGSFGKTSTKEHLRDLLTGTFEVLASPASFNNKAGLSRAINEQMSPSCEVFIAEMGTYGAGEIRELCRSIPPRIAVITAIGPVHLERMGTLERITEAKAEILEAAQTAVLNVDSPHLAGLADRVRAPVTVVRCATGGDADVVVEDADGRLTIRAAGRTETVARPVGVHASNVACAVGAALAVGVGLDAVVARLPALAVPAHRVQESTAASGVRILDDTYNANPDGARAAVHALAAAPVTGRRVVVTPGMVELGREQERANEAFARDTAAVVDELVIVNRKNRGALLRGARAGGVEPIVKRNREEAVEWVREHLTAGDAVLYENDLPDHYP